MAKIEFPEIDEYANRLRAIGEDSEEIIKSAVYAGANVVADAIKQNLKTIPIEEGENGLPPVVHEGEMLTGVSRKQKGDLIDGFGLAPMENNGDYVNTKAGFDGYGSVKTKKYPKGVPNAMLMRSVESGTSFRQKHPVVRPAVNKSRKRAQAAIEEELDKQIKSRME